ncbi:CHAT domain-containing protein [Cognataquiflexum rubidum]|uniref:CHAT domain-containing protein n=1 Tax=Cognataquiflexum rubidum TaxID=2922273 RepID=UPI001F14024F|nr:CHAT domain-containing tetratricopeptide repeat protein [Cognataquiflexum rubidum]MCH6234209.1 CHAT domain-containing protein [Cognataquiflexum rubidum]
MNRFGRFTVFSFFFISAFWLPYFTLFAIQKRSSDPLEWLDRLNEIRSQQISIDNKIVDLHQLVKSYLKHGYGKDSIYARMVHRLGDFYRIKKDNDKAIQFFQEAIKINSSDQKNAEYKYLCETYCNLGLTYLDIDFEIAEDYFEKSLQIFRKYPEEKSFVAVIIQDNRASHYFGLGDYQNAINIIDYAIVTIPNIGNTMDENMLLLQKAYSLLQINELDQSEKIFEKIIKDYDTEGVDLDSKATAFSLYSQFLENSGRISEALTYLEKCLTIRKALGFKDAVANTLYKMGSLLSETNSKASLVYFQEALSFISENDTEKYRSIVNNGIGVTYQNMNSHLEALKYFQLGIINLGIGFKNQNIFSNPTVSDLKFCSNDQIGVILLKNKGESLTELFKKDPNENIYLDASIKTHFLADELVNQMRWNQKTQVSKEFWRGKTKSLYEKALETSFLAKNTEHAFYFLEKSRAVLLNDRLKELGATQLLSEIDAKKENSLRISIENFQREIGSNFFDKLQNQILIKDFHDEKQEYEKFVKSLEVKYPAYYQYKYDTMVLSIEDVRNKIISEDQVYVSYFIGSDNMFILKIGKEDTYFDMIPIGKIPEKIDKLNQMVVDKVKLNNNYSQFLDLSHEVYKDLVYPLGLNNERIIVSMEDKLLPFEILITNPGNPSSFLIKNHSLSFTYSAKFLTKSRENIKNDKLHWLGIAPVNYSSTVQKGVLHGSDVSLKKLAGFFPKPKILIDQNASKSNFLKEFYKYSVVQVYSHAEADGLEVEPRIYMYDDNIKLSEIPFLKDLQTELIILTACNTGVGKSIKGEGVMSLARGFASIGIPSSITSLWEVDDIATYKITELFYKYLNEGYFSDIALQKAKLDYLNLYDKENMIPYYWGGMVLIGSAYQFEIEENHFPYHLVWIGLSLILFSLIGFFWKKKRSMYPQ